MNNDPQPELQQPTAYPSAPEKKFHGWRLVGFITCVVVVIAIASATVDWAVIGPLEGRAY
jgi:hypothetical protein